MRRFLLAIVASFFAASSYAGGLPAPYTPTPSPITVRAPTVNDDTTKGWAIGSVWQYAGTVYQALSVTTGAAVWVPQASAQYPVYAAPSSRSFNGQGAGVQQRIVDILGTSAQVACGTVALKAGYTGKSITVTTTVSASPVTTDIDILSTGLLDTATLNTTLAAADVGTTAYVTKCWDQTGNGNHLTKHASYPGPIIGERSYNGIPEMSWGNLLGDAGLVIPNAVTSTGNNFAAYVLGEMMAATGSNTTVFEVGDSSTISGPSLSIIVPLSSANTATGLNIFTRAMGTPSPGLPVMSSATKGQVFGINSGASSATIFSNETSATVTGISNATFVGGNLGRVALDTGYRGMASVFGFVVTNAVSTSDQLTKIKQGAYTLYGFSPQIMDQVFTLGDSRTQGLQTNINNSWPTQMTPMLNAVRPVNVYNIGVSGQTALKVSQYSASSVVSQKITGARNIVTIGPIGTNDMNSGSTAATAFGYMQAACAAATVSGVTTIAVNELPRDDGTNTKITTYRALFNAGPTGCTYSIDPAGNVPQLADATNTIYYPDGLHLSDAGSGLLGQYIAQTIAPLLR